MTHFLFDDSSFNILKSCHLVPKSDLMLSRITSISRFEGVCFPKKAEDYSEAIFERHLREQTVDAPESLNNLHDPILNSLRSITVQVNHGQKIIHRSHLAGPFTGIKILKAGGAKLFFVYFLTRIFLQTAFRSLRLEKIIPNEDGFVKVKKVEFCRNNGEDVVRIFIHKQGSGYDTLSGFFDWF